MLKIKTKNSKLYVRTLEALALSLAIIGLFYLADLVFEMWQRDLCGTVQISYYHNGTAPAKCQELWNRKGL